MKNVCNGLTGNWLSQIPELELAVLTAEGVLSFTPAKTILSIEVSYSTRVDSVDTQQYRPRFQGR